VRSSRKKTAMWTSRPVWKQLMILTSLCVQPSRASPSVPRFRDIHWFVRVRRMFVPQDPHYPRFGDQHWQQRVLRMYGPHEPHHRQWGDQHWRGGVPLLCGPHERGRHYPRLRDIHWFAQPSTPTQTTATQTTSCSSCASSVFQAFRQTEAQAKKDGACPSSATSRLP